MFVVFLWLASGILIYACASADKEFTLWTKVRLLPAVAMFWPVVIFMFIQDIIESQGVKS